MDGGGIALRDVDGGGAVVEAVWGDASVAIGERIAEGHGMIHRVLQSGRAAASSPDERLPGAISAHDGETFPLGAAAPVGAQSVDGVLLLVGADHSQRLGDRDVALLCDFARLAGRTLDSRSSGHRLESALHGEVGALIAAAELRQAGLALHVGGVKGLATAIGRRLGLDGESLTELQFAAQLHDVGKIRIPVEILHKPGPLDSSEWEIIRRHPRWGFELLAAIPGLELVAPSVLFHHERWDGAGYPYGLAGARIPLAGRIISVCDAYGAMTADRPYQAAVAPSVALWEIGELGGAQFDPDVAEALGPSLIASAPGPRFERAALDRRAQTS